MYRPYVDNKTVKAKHLPTILDVEVDYSRASHALAWSIAAAAIAGLGLAVWFGQIPLR